MLKYISLCLFLIMSTSVASAQDIERFRLPAGHRLYVDGETYQGFDLGEYQELLRMDVDLRFYSSAYPNCTEQITLFTEEVQSLREAVSISEDTVTRLTEENQRLYSRWSEENRLRHAAENRPNFGSVLSWGLAGGFGISTLVLLLVAIL